MIFEEGEDFEISFGGGITGRYIVESVAPWEVDLNKELNGDDPYAEIKNVLARLVAEGRISKFEPDYKISINLFDDVITFEDCRSELFDED